MADPRSNLFSVKPCGQSTLGKSHSAISAATSDRKNFFGALGKIGDLEVLNSVGAGKIGAGLRTLSSISNTIRQGTGALPTSIGSAVGGGLDAGANWVLNTVGIARPLVDAAKTFNPGIANQGLGQAKAVYEKVTKGGFKATDIPGVLQDFQNLERLTRNVFTPSAGENKSITERCEASPYAMDLIGRAPKYKFLFVVQFVFNSPYEYIGEHDFAFVVKKSTRPSVNFELEDVNYYNFRSTFATKTDFADMDMSFYDDNTNSATMFYKLYTEAMSPIAKRTSLLHPELSGLAFDRPDTPPATKEEIARDSYGGQYPNYNVATNGTKPDSLNTASLGALMAAPAGGGQSVSNVSILKEIKLFHVYDYGNKMNVHRFMNPRIKSLVSDGLDMSIGNEGSELSIKFTYDSVYIDAGVPMNSTEYSLSESQRGAVYPLKHNGGDSSASQLASMGAASNIPGLATPPFVSNLMSKVTDIKNSVVSNRTPSTQGAVTAITGEQQFRDSFK